MLEDNLGVSVKEATDWLMMFRDPHTKLLELWSLTRKERLQFIHGEAGKKVVLNEVLSAWPKYKDKDGHILVSTLILCSALCHLEIFSFVCTTLLPQI